MGQGWARILRALVACATGLLLQSCIAPNAELSFVPAVGSTGNFSNINTLFWSGPNTVPQNICQSYVLNSQHNGAVLVATSPVPISVGTSSGGGFYLNAACTESIGVLTIPSGSSTVTVYFKASNSGSIFLQAWAQNYALSSYTVTVTAVLGPAALLKFTTQPSSTATSGEVFSTQPVVQVQDSNGNLVTTASSTISLSVFQDSACTIGAASGTLNATSITANGGIASFANVSYTLYSAAANIYLQANSSSGLTSACSSVIDVSVAMMSVAVATGSACARASDGTVYCWGDNTYGQLGNGSSTTSGVPTQVLGANGIGTLFGVTQLAGGNYEFCAVSSGNVYCWGNNSNGQLGNNTTLNSTVPVAVSGLSGVTSVSVGFEAACAVTSTGNAYCWGLNSSGQLGDSLTTDSYIPVEVVNTTGVTAMSSVTSISMGNSDACAVSSGYVYCWGLASDGALGNNNAASTVGVPVQVVGTTGSGLLSGINSVAVNAHSACAINSTGALYCWGNNGSGELGDGTTMNAFYPVPITGYVGGASISSLGSIGDSCVLNTAGAAYCWGNNTYGNLGNGSTAQELGPTSVLASGSTPMTGVSSLSTGGEASCAVISGNVYCWGDNSEGECGQGTTGGTELVPVAVVSTTGLGIL